jgi:4-hydroxybenzoate polyprenyltransferase
VRPVSVTRVPSRSRLDSWIGAVRLVHVFPSITVIAGSTVLMFVAHRGVPGIGVLLRGVTVVTTSQIAVGALNDFIDRGDDARTQPEKPLPSKQTSTGVAKAMVIGGIVMCCTLALTFGLGSLGLVAIGLGSGLAYDLRLKRTPFSPITYMVSFLALLTWVWLVAGTLTWSVLIVYPFGACLLLAAHLANALPDAKTDAALGQRGLAVVLGPRRALTVVLVVSGSAAICALAFCIVEHASLGVIFSLMGGVLVLSAAWPTRRPDLDRAALQAIFRRIAPAIALIAASCLLAFEAAGQA